MVSEAVTAAPEAINEESAKTNVADRQTETQPVAVTTQADDTKFGTEPNMAGETQQDAKPVSSASTKTATKKAKPTDAESTDIKEELGPLPLPKISATALTPGDIVKQMEEEVFEPIRSAMTAAVTVQHQLLTEFQRVASWAVAEQERGYGMVRNIILANHKLISDAKKEFSQQGRRVPVPGRPTYTQWLNDRLTITMPDGSKAHAISDRYVRKVMAEGQDLFNQALDASQEEITESKKRLEETNRSSYSGANRKSGDGKVPHERKLVTETAVDKNASAEIEEAKEKSHKTAVGSTHSLYKPGNWMALYNMLNNHGNPGLVPLDAVLGGLEPAEVVANVARLTEKIATEFCDGRKIRVIVELAD